MSDTAQEVRPRKWWVLESYRYPVLAFQGKYGLTTVAPFWDSTHWKNALSFVYFKYIEWKQKG